MNNEITDQVLDWIRNRHFGKYRGLVVNNLDPTNRGRVKVRVPSVLGDLEPWALPCLPYSGDNMGTFFMPEKGAGIWVEFEAGDPSYPIWTGGFWADQELPKDNQNTGATPPLKIIRSKKGLMITLEDKNEIISISDSKGDNILSIEAKEGKIILKAKKKITLEAKEIEFTENASEPLVLGNKLLEYLNQAIQSINSHTHTHPQGPTGPPVAPAQSPQSTLLSTQVKSE
jgi:uncharacterized protein involved in type VI secretion and phage assembly